MPTSEIKGKLIPNTTRMDVLTCHLGSHCRNPVEIRNANLQYLGHAGFKTFYFGFDPEVILWKIIEHDETEEHLLSAHRDIPTWPISVHFSDCVFIRIIKRTWPIINSSNTHNTSNSDATIIHTTSTLQGWKVNIGSHLFLSTSSFETHYSQHNFGSDLWFV